jgi:ADP-ribose pyrophosphatase
MPMPTPDVKVLNVRPVHAGRVVNLRLEEIELPGGRRTTLELIRHPGAAAIVPVLPTGEVLLVRQYRHAAAGTVLLEVPAGTLNAGESPEQCATRECAEESGFRPGRLEPLGWLWTTPGFTDERIWLYLALDLEPEAQALDDDEMLSVERLPLAKALDLALRGGIDDGKSITALARACARLGVAPSRA